MNGRGTHYSFGPPITPPIIKNLIIANVVVFLAQTLTPVIDNLGAIRPYDVWLEGKVWQPFTYMWLHSKYSVFHIMFNMFALWMFGSQMALVWGEKRFLRYYLVCGVGAGVLIATVPFLLYWLGFPASSIAYRTLGASGAVMGVLLAYSFTFPDRTIQLLFPPIPIKAIWLIPFIFFMEYFSSQQNISHTGHLGGVLVGWIYLVYEGRTPGAPTIDNIMMRWKRHQMRQRLRAVHDEERRDRSRKRDEDDRTFH